MNILFTAEYDEALIEEVKQLGDVHIQGWAKGIGKLSEKELIPLVDNVEVIVTSYDDITKAIIDAAPKLELIFCTRATPVNVDVDYAQEKGIKVLFTPGRNSDSTAELTIGLMLSIARKIPFAYKQLKKGNYTASSNKGNRAKEGLKRDVVWGVGPQSPYVVFKGIELKGRTLGIIGYGSIGRRVAAIARGFGMRILVFDPYVSNVDVDTLITEKVGIEELLIESDFISVHLKVSKETENFINKSSFAKMKDSAYFINCSRAAVVDEEDLIEALRTKQIAGAGLDVFSTEPIPESHPFIQELDNVVITPHIAGATTDVLTNHTKMIIQELDRFKKEEPLLYEYKQ
ncbi:2-hydroxyacid dehydrogenase [Candidatus Enterococcus murrayae]|uniref:2-hydroxyacid dehydrogenase n=1 Tax=Candidatus Enterococcus murrayae TaxID=2815321 RepID=A0ABS3HJ54_9ENTE|nr:2-hydroxyacid dehydrogenase [Enterococcus sp. MJM16]MBO0452583.1 2-hydroxyacid dehydrogenase [Enterococcus sp. MJM16]